MTMWNGAKIKKILGRFFAGVGILVTAMFVLSFSIGAYWFSEPDADIEIPDSMVLHLDFSQPITETTQPPGLNFQTLLHGEDEMRLFLALGALDRAKDDPRIKAIVARFGGEQPSLAHAQELRRALDKIRAAGKPTYAFGPNYGDFGLGNRTFYLASAFEHIWLQPVGVVGLSGIGSQSFFGKSALEKIGVKADFRRREDYKSVMENVSRDNYSAPVRANMESLMKDIARQVASGIAQSRKMDDATIQQKMRQGPFTATEAAKANLVTHIGYDDEMMKEIEDKFGKETASVDVETYVAYTRHENRDVEPKARIAFINAQGLITDIKPSGPKRLAEEEVINTDEIVEAFHNAAEDKEIKAILFRVNSQGGSPAASESIRRALIKAKESKKPIFVSMGDVAASGGYWISMNGDRIFAESGTLTGSIGVVVGKMVIGGLLEKIGIKADEIMLDPNARLWSPLSSFSPEEQKRIDALLDETYTAFTTNVAAARKIPPEKMPDLAKGRVFTGDQAQRLGLVDEIGGVQAVLSALKKELKLEESDKIQLVAFPPPETTFSMILKIMQNLGLEMALNQGARALFAPLAAQTSPLHPLLASAQKELQAALLLPPTQLTLAPAFQALVR